MLFWSKVSLKSLLSGFTYAQNVPEYLMIVLKKSNPPIRFLVFFVEIALKLENVGPTFSSLNPFPSLPSVPANDRKSNKRHYIDLKLQT